MAASALFAPSRGWTRILRPFKTVALGVPTCSVGLYTPCVSSTRRCTTGCAGAGSGRIGIDEADAARGDAAVDGGEQGCTTAVAELALLLGLEFPSQDEDDEGETRGNGTGIAELALLLGLEFPGDHKDDEGETPWEKGRVAP